MEATEPLDAALKFYDELLEADETNGLKCLPAPTIIDAANILWRSIYTPINFSPTLCQVTKPLRVILHTWAKTRQCTLVTRRPRGHGFYYAIKMKRVEGLSYPWSFLQTVDRNLEIIFPFF